MKVGVHGKKFSNQNVALIRSITDDLISRDHEIYFSDEFTKALKRKKVDISGSKKYSIGEKLDFLDYLITLGGDGTLLEAVTHIDGLQIPVLGINTGRMGFLATISKDSAIDALSDLFNGKFSYDERTLLCLESNNGLFKPNNYALNDFTILKKDTSSMINVKVYIDGEFLNSYWSDGIVVATPTGSTGYSMSCGGPLIMPGSQSFIITPVSPHNLTVRPMIVPDHKELSFKIEGRSDNYLISLDSRYETVDDKVKLRIRKADFPVKLVKLDDSSYFKTIRQKLSWGIDIRN